jgi:hypothetical protein
VEPVSKSFEKLRTLIDYILELVKFQYTMTLEEAESLKISSRTFNIESTPTILRDVIQLIDNNSKPHENLESEHARIGLLAHVIKQLFTIINILNKAGKEFVFMWQGIRECVQSSDVPILWLRIMGDSIASTANLATLVEDGIDRQLEITRGEYSALPYIPLHNTFNFSKNR